MSDDPTGSPTDEPDAEGPAESHPPVESETADPDASTATADPKFPTMTAATDRFDVARFRRLLDRGLLVAFVLLAVVAALQFYLQVGAAIETWIATEYEPIAKALFNLALLLVAVAGVSHQLRRLSGDADAATGEE